MKYYVSKSFMRKLTVEVMGIETELELTNDNGMVDCLPIYKTKEQAKKTYPNHEIFEIETMGKELSEEE